MDDLSCLVIVLVGLLSSVVTFVLFPWALVAVLSLFGIALTFWQAFGIVVLLSFLAGLFN